MSAPLSTQRSAEWQPAVADVLERAADLIEPEGAWTQGAFSRDSDGETGDDLVADNPACRCVLGAIAHVVGRDPSACRAWNDAGIMKLAHDALLGIVRNPAFDVVDWNDAPERTQSEVVAKLREAAAKARGDQP